jgi:hypothetical protein
MSTILNIFLLLCQIITADGSSLDYWFSEARVGLQVWVWRGWEGRPSRKWHGRHVRWQKFKQLHRYKFWFHLGPLWLSQSVLHRPVQQWLVPIHTQCHCQDWTNWWVWQMKGANSARQSLGENNWEGAQERVWEQVLAGHSGRPLFLPVSDGPPYHEPLPLPLGSVTTKHVWRKTASELLTLLSFLLLFRVSSRTQVSSWEKD